MEFPPARPFRHGFASDAAVTHCVQGHGLRDIVRYVEQTDTLVDIVHQGLVVDVSERWGERISGMPVVPRGIQDRGHSKSAGILMVIFG